MPVIITKCIRPDCGRMLTYEYKGYGRKRSYCSPSCSGKAKKDQDGSRDRRGERERIRANRVARKNRNALRGISDYEIEAEGLTVRGRESSLKAGHVGPSEGSTSPGLQMPDISDHEWFRENPHWDEGL